MKVGIILYPGSNCIEETIKYFTDRRNHVVKIWHKEDDFEKYFDLNLLVIPGGFAFGDRYYEKATHAYTISPGQMAKESPVSKIILKCHSEKIPIIGICNGFQILIQLGLLPGKLCQNVSKTFYCGSIECHLHSSIVPNNDAPIMLNVANGYGNYQCTFNEYTTLVKNDQILITYENKKQYEYHELNGSRKSIGGVMNKDKTVLGMMPHPERSFSQDYDFYTVIEKFATYNPLKEKFIENIEKLMSSEHISYKSTKQFLKQLYSDEDHVVVGPGENAGIVDIGDGYCLAIRIESHNHPTFIDPYNGASTGVGGILRDILTMGARPIGILDFLKFGTDENSQRLLKETVRGISDYGNCFGVANVGGSCYTHEMYDKNPLVNVAAIGIMKRDSLICGNVSNYDELLIYVGAKTGTDGIGGADMASQTFDSNKDMSELKKNIQVGDPFLEKLLLEACLEITDNKLAIGMQDMGAGGLLCASLEVVLRGRNKYEINTFGCEIYADKIPTKCEMDDCDKLISESQERMLLVVNRENEQKVYDIFDKWDLEYCCVGIVTKDNNYTVKNEDKILFQKNVESFGEYVEDWGFEWKQNNPCRAATETDSNMEFKTLNEWSSYDNTIGNRTLDISRHTEDRQISIIRLHEINKNLVITWGKSLEECHNCAIKFNTYKILGYINCLNYGEPSNSVGDLVNFLYETNIFAKNIKCPVLGGNVSLYNATDGKSIMPSPMIVMIGLQNLHDIE